MAWDGQRFSSQVLHLPASPCELKCVHFPMPSGPSLRKNVLQPRSLLLGLLLTLGWANWSWAEQGLNVLVNGKRQTLLPVGFDTHSVVALTANGSMLQLKQGDLKDPKVVPQFQVYSPQQMRAELLHEFGRHFEVSGTGTYLVVHPQGARDLWADHFEELYRSMVRFFRARQFPIHAPKFPLVAIVFYSQKQYTDYCQRILKSDVSGTCGVYLHNTNRIYLYDDTKGVDTNSPRWQENLSTIMHEAAHQTAYNCGIHDRAAETPVWLVEGLGCLFEGKGVYNAFKFRKTEDRINIGRLYSFKKDVLVDAESSIASVVASDSLFRRNPVRAYAVAWGMTFYFSEREPQKYMRYLRQVAQHEPLTPYPASLRVQEFNEIFGDDYEMLSARITRYLDDLPMPAWAR